MKVEYIDIDGEDMFCYIKDVDSPIISLEKEELFNWLFRNDLLSWSSKNEQSGSFTMDEYFDQDESIIKADVEKYIAAMMEDVALATPSKMRSEQEIREALDKVRWLEYHEASVGYMNFDYGDFIQLLEWVLGGEPLDILDA